MPESNLKRKACGLKYVQGNTLIRTPLLWVRYSFLTQNPFCRVVFNVLPDFVVILLIADHMVVIRTLEQLFTGMNEQRVYLLGNMVFVPTDHISQYRGRVSRPIIHPQQHMYVIRHDDIPINRYGWIFVGNLVDPFFRDYSATFWDGKPVPYDVAEEFLSVLCADSDEIGTIGAVVIFT